MSIEFPCSGCSNVLQVPNDSAGKQARCPSCGQISDVPASGDEAHDRAAATPLSDFTSQSAQRLKTEIGDAENVNPFQSPPQKVRGPAGEPDQVASRGIRLVGALLDGFLHIVAFGLLAIPGWLAGSAVDANDEDLVVGLTVIFGFAGVFVLKMINWVMITNSGQSIGKRILGVRIIRIDGHPPGFVHGVLLRNWIPFVINQLCGLFAFFDAAWIFGRERRCLHDLIASTHVIVVVDQPTDSTVAETVADYRFRDSR